MKTKQFKEANLVEQIYSLDETHFDFMAEMACGKCNCKLHRLAKYAERLEASDE
jgi:hypothetical protein